ncbi:tannase/feruloyl esterase family alpha/beta hydrolase [Kordiimonas pumila]|uniref:Tannase/feruloyl esterase family alpha/beta hydrolase n=1 Tax=Kordiimonas pumila TaxID=2161677 RepID=A0ABV7D4Q5_9PROT|nr:tannase/feruloyl esterase family alpha/beta hydrolase [Kordiimonas pumila]
MTKKLQMNTHKLKRRLTAVSFLASLLLIMLAVPLQASPPPAVEDPCSALRILDLSELDGGQVRAKVMSGSMIHNQEMTDAEAWQTKRRSRAMAAVLPEDVKAIPDHCLVAGYINPQINFELRLPAIEDWNGKFLLVACDGWCGKISTDATLAGLMHGYATMMNNGGHWGEHPFDGTWAADNIQARRDFAYRANHVAPITAKAIIGTYYGVQPTRSYMTGCSKGGQAGAMTASRYPTDFDGVLMRGPTIDYTSVNVLRCTSLEKAAFTPDGKPRMNAAKVPALQRAVMDACDELDGVKDNLISDPRKCDFDPVTIQCGKGSVGPVCLTEEEVDVVKNIYAPIYSETGEFLYPGSAYGSESAWPGWTLPVTGESPIHGDKLTYSQQCGGDYLRFMAFPESKEPGWHWRTDFNWERDKELLKDIGDMWDVNDPDFSAFRDAGGKMIIIHGWADSAIPAEASIVWYDKVSNAMGGRDAVADFARMFLMPGADHCDGGVGFESFDALKLLDDWVENGKAPDAMIAQQKVDGEVVRERPVYPYPLEAKYKGEGSIDVPQNFESHDPRK